LPRSDDDWFTAQASVTRQGGVPECPAVVRMTIFRNRRRPGKLVVRPEQNERTMFMRRSFIPIIVLGVAGIAFAAFAYLSSGTGVAGTLGALLALIGAAAVLIGSLVAAFARLGGVLFGLLVLLIAIGAILTALAGYFLMQFGLAAVMSLALIALLVAVLLPAPQRRPI